MVYRAAAILMLVGSITGCGNERVANYQVNSPDILSPSPITKPVGKVGVCHNTGVLGTDGNPIYQKISVSANGWLNGHQKHGDELAGGPVLDENCEPIVSPPPSSCSSFDTLPFQIEGVEWTDYTNEENPDGSWYTVLYDVNSSDPILWLQVGGDGMGNWYYVDINDGYAIPPISEEEALACQQVIIDLAVEAGLD